MSYKRNFILIKNFYELVVSIDMSLHCTGELYTRYISTDSIIEISDLINSPIFSAIESVVHPFEDDEMFFESKEYTSKNDFLDKEKDRDEENDEDEEDNISGIEIVSIDEKSLALFSFIYDHKEMTLLKTSQNSYYFLDYIKPDKYYEKYTQFCNKSFIYN